MATILVPSSTRAFPPCCHSVRLTLLQWSVLVIGWAKRSLDEQRGLLCALITLYSLSLPLPPEGSVGEEDELLLELLIQFVFLFLDFSIAMRSGLLLLCFHSLTFTQFQRSQNVQLTDPGACVYPVTYSPIHQVLLFPPAPVLIHVLCAASGVLFVAPTIAAVIVLCTKTLCPSQITIFLI